MAMKFSDTSGYKWAKNKKVWWLLLKSLLLIYDLYILTLLFCIFSLWFPAAHGLHFCKATVNSCWLKILKTTISRNIEIWKFQGVLTLLFYRVYCQAFSLPYRGKKQRKKNCQHAVHCAWHFHFVRCDENHLLKFSLQGFRTKRSEHSTVTLFRLKNPQLFKTVCRFRLCCD